MRFVPLWVYGGGGRGKFLVFAGGVVVELGSGATLIANTTSNGNETVTALFTRRNTGIILTSVGGRNIRRIATSLRRGNYRILSIIVSMAGRSSVRQVMSATVSTFKELSVLVGGANVFSVLIPITSASSTL